MDGFKIKSLIMSAMVLSAVGLTALRAWVITMIWQWYFVPTFDAQPISMVSAYGILLLTHFFTFKPQKHESADFAEAAGDYSTLLLTGIMQAVAIAFMGLAVISWWPL